jgi:hypothetical protein
MNRLQMLRHARRGVVGKHLLVVIDTRRGETLALGEWAKMEGLGCMLDGHLKRQIQVPIIYTPLASSIEEIRIKLHFLIFDKPPNGQEELGLHNQNRVAARFVTWEGSSSSHDPIFSREAAFAHQCLCHASVFHSRDDCAPLFRPPRDSKLGRVNRLA